MSATIAVVATLADMKRQRRRNLDKVGFMPWTLITVLSVMATLFLTAIALKLHQ
ncbi:hypothetical protein [Sphingomonas sp. C3-2]|uniref:hypothetical protein n=1 Tax=Sphingomonas sp. C3-2 TaxID=3062169 RepID=UPI00294B01D7|nr:hypothetical protein [Sphingomonas sp. C3-2]WOK36378.1 hypothetical protein QYC26_15465 [Sphingomonas sp. C3-2]